MSALGATSPAGSNLAALIAANVPSSPPSNPPPSALADTAAGNDRGPPTNIQLSDKVKSILARAETDQAVADRLKSFVQKQRTGGTGSAPTEAGSKTDIAVAFQHLSGSSDQAPDSSQAFSPVEPAISFSNHAQFGGFSVSVTADAATGSFSTVVNGPGGVSFFDKRFGRSAGVAGGTAPAPDITVGSEQTGNVQYITFTRSDSAAASATASSGPDSVTASATEAQVSSVTFAIDFTTGAIQVTQADASTASATAQVNQRRSPLSIVA